MRSSIFSAAKSSNSMLISVQDLVRFLLLNLFSSRFESEMIELNLKLVEDQIDGFLPRIGRAEMCRCCADQEL